MDFAERECLEVEDSIGKMVAAAGVWMPGRMGELKTRFVQWSAFLVGGYLLGMTDRRCFGAAATKFWCAEFWVAVLPVVGELRRNPMKLSGWVITALRAHFRLSIVTYLPFYFSTVLKVFHVASSVPSHTHGLMVLLCYVM